MQNYSDLVGLSRIDSVDRIGSDVVLSLRHAVRSFNRRDSGKVTFVGVTRIESVDERNDLVQRELEPGFKVDGLRFQDGVAKLYVYEVDMHDRYPVMHSISCAEVRIRMRIAILRTLANIFY